MNDTTPHIYDRRRGFSHWLKRGTSFRARFAMRAGALVLLGAVIANGVVRGGYLDYEGSPWPKLPGKAAGVVGMAAEDITISGLTHHDPETLLSAIGVMPGGSLIGFDPVNARHILEHLDWTKSAKVQRLFPNQLVIEVVEREPFAIWQRSGEYYVIDKTGAAMTGLPASQVVKLPLVSGEGANTAAAELFNHLEATPDLLLQVKAAARVGDRRWTLYLDSGVTVLLPETGIDEAIRKVDDLDRSQHILSKGIRSVDLRLADRVVVNVAEADAGGGGTGRKKAAKAN